jgi:hypothetical protein
MTIYDAFLSYDPADAEWVEGWLLPRLQKARLKIATADDFVLGRPRLVNIEHMVDESWHTLCVLSPAWLISEWSMFDELLSHTADPTGMKQRIIPLRRQACELPRRIAMLDAADFTGPAERWDRQFQRIVSALGSVIHPSPPDTIVPKLTPLHTDVGVQIDELDEKLQQLRERAKKLEAAINQPSRAIEPPLLKRSKLIRERKDNLKKSQQLRERAKKPEATINRPPQAIEPPLLKRSKLIRERKDNLK